MDKLKSIKKLRSKLKKQASIGSWIQIPNSSVAEIIGDSGYDWAAVDMEHGQISTDSLPDLFRALELGDTLPLVRVAQPSSNDCKLALEAGAAGVIIPLIESADQLFELIQYSQWPPAGKRGVGFSRANLFGKYFTKYSKESQSPFIVAMIESKKGADNIDEILKVSGLDAVFIGPYDLSASLGKTGQFKSEIYTDTIDTIKSKCEKSGIPFGIHIVEPSLNELETKLNDGFRFIAYSIDTVHLRNSLELVFKKNNKL